MSKQASAFALPVAPLVEKMNSLDPDYRVMALMDTQKELTRSTNAQTSRTPARPLDQTYMDEITEGKLLAQVLKLLGDSNAEVKNAAVPCLALLTRKARKAAMHIITTELMNAIGSDDDEKRDVACLALKSVVAEMPLDGPSTADSIDTLVVKILQILQSADDHPQVSFELLAILTDIFTRFKAIITTLSSTQHTALSQLSILLSTARPNIRKRSTSTLAALISSSDSSLFEELVQDLLNGLASDDQETSRAWVGVLGALARSSARLVGGVLEKALPSVLQQLEDVEDADAVEGALVTLEVLVLRCPTETSAYLPHVVTKALELVKYDPNFVQLDDDEDDPMEDADDELDEDDDYEDAYSDDEDVSWKIRRSAAKLLLVLIATRNELLADFYKAASPVLILRFEEREESVRIEVLEAYRALLTQTAAVSGASEQTGRNKRKRSEGMDEPDDETPLSHLQAQLPALLKVLLKLLSVKSLATRQQAFSLLRQITLVLDGGLEAHASAICKAVASALHSSDHGLASGGGATISSLTVAVLSFLSAFFAHHPSRVYASHLHDLAPRIVVAMLDKLQRVSAEGFVAASALVCAIRPVSRGSASPLPGNYVDSVLQIYTATKDILAGNTADADVRERALETLGDLLVHEGDSLANSLSECLPLVTGRLANEGTQSTAVLVIGRIAESPTAKGDVFDAWLLEALTSVAVSIRRNKRLSKSSALNCLSALLTRISSSLPETTASDLILELKPLLDTPAALHVVVLVLSLQPASHDTIESEILPTVLEQLQSPLIQAPAVDALLPFFSAWVAADQDCATRLVSRIAGLLDTSGRLPDASQGGTVAYTTAAKCIGAIVSNSQRNATSIISLFAGAPLKQGSEAETYFALLALGEIGRTTDMSLSHEVFEHVLALFGSKSEEVRSAAAFAAGNMAVGSPAELLPAILRNLTADKTAAERLLFLHALKEVILHMTASQLEAIADSLWAPLFADESEIESEDDGERNVKAACIGKLTTANPMKYLPQLQSRLQSSAATRATVAAAIRYTFIDTSSSYDELLAPFVVDFLSLMHDSDLLVRRLSLNSLNAAIQNKPHLVIDHLATLQPLLYSETHVKPELCRKVPMGPWTVIEDDGLENRKTAYETMYTMLATCFIKIDLSTFFNRVIAALSDVNEVKVLGFMLLLRLSELAPTLVASGLDDTTEAFDLTMRDLELKDDTIRQDLERKEEMQRSAMRTLVPLYRLSSPAHNPVFNPFAARVLANPKWKDLKEFI